MRQSGVCTVERPWSLLSSCISCSCTSMICQICSASAARLGLHERDSRATSSPAGLTCHRTQQLPGAHRGQRAAQVQPGAALRQHRRHAEARNHSRGASKRGQQQHRVDGQHGPHQGAKRGPLAECGAAQKQIPVRTVAAVSACAWLGKGGASAARTSFSCEQAQPGRSPAGFVPDMHRLKPTATDPHRLFRLLGVGCRDASQDAHTTKPKTPSMPPSPVTRLVYVPAAATPSAHACSHSSQP